MKRNIPKWQKTSKLHYLMLGLITFLSIFPFYWMFIVSSNTDAEISSFAISNCQQDAESLMDWNKNKKNKNLKIKQYLKYYGLLIRN